MNPKYLNKVMHDKKLDAIFLLSDQNRTWFTKFPTTAGALIVTKDENTLFLDGRYIAAGRENAKNVNVKFWKKSNDFFNWVNLQGFKRIGIEEDYTTIKIYNQLKKVMPNIIFEEINGAELRNVKTSEEADIIKKACYITHKAMEAVKDLIKPGISEIEIRNHLESKMLHFGAKKPGFDSIVVSGPRGALPHGNPTDKLLEEGELVTIDCGAEYLGYTADITRTYHVGKVTNQKLLEIFQIVKDAQELGIKAIKPGINASDIDKVCRDYITDKGYGEYFIHGTGHGLGVEVHEQPIVSPIYKGVLESGNVITVEPGIYIEGIGGTRFEDDILVTEGGYKILSR